MVRKVADEPSSELLLAPFAAAPRQPVSFKAFLNEVFSMGSATANKPKHSIESIDRGALDSFLGEVVSDPGAGLSAALVQAGEGKIREVVSKGGFIRFRRAAESPFNLVFEAKP